MGSTGNALTAYEAGTTIGGPIVGVVSALASLFGGSSGSDWGSGEDWSLKFLSEYGSKGLTRSDTDHAGSKVRSGEWSESQARSWLDSVAKERGYGGGGGGSESFSVPQSELEKTLSSYLTGIMNQGVEGVFSGEFGQQMLDTLKGLIDPNKQSIPVDLMYQKIADEVVNPAIKTQQESMLNRLGAQGISTGGLAADAMGNLDSNRAQQLASAMRDLLIENQTLKKEDIATALQGFGIGADFLQNVLGQSNQLVSTRGNLDLGADKLGLEQYLGELANQLGMDQLAFNKYVQEQTWNRADDEAENSYWDSLINWGANKLLGTNSSSSSSSSDLSWIDKLFNSSSSSSSNTGSSSYLKSLPVTTSLVNGISSYGYIH